MLVDFEMFYFYFLIKIFSINVIENFYFKLI